MTRTTPAHVRGVGAPRFRVARFVILVGALCATTGLLRPAVGGADPLDPIPMFCGRPASSTLNAGATQSLRFSLETGSTFLLEAIDTSGTIGPLRLRVPDAGIDTCQGNFVLASTGNSGTVEVSACSGGRAGTYTASLVVISDGPDNCGVPLPCRTAVAGRIDPAGEVDSYSFDGVEGDDVTVRVTNTGTTIGALRLRVFDPAGLQVSGGDSCPARPLQLRLPRTGTYTVLVSSCSGPQRGTYSVAWEPTTCPAATPPGMLAYVANADSGTLSVVDISTNTVQLVAPIAARGQAELGIPMGLAITPNGGFAYVTYGTASNATVINTSTNLRTASIPVGLDNAAVTVHPAGTFAYTIANGFGGIAVVDTMTSRTTAVVAPEIGESTTIAVTPDGSAIYVVSDDLGGLASITTSDYEIASFTPLDLGLYDALAISPGGDAVYTGTLEGITVVDPVTHQPSGQIEMSEPFAIVFAADGRTAYASLVDDGKVAVIDTAALRVSALIPVAQNPGGLALPPDGTRLYVTDITSTAHEPGLFIVDTTTQQIVESLATLGDGPTDVELTVPPQGLCVGNARGQTEVTIDELVRSVGYSLTECPGRFPMSVAPPP